MIEYAKSAVHVARYHLVHGGGDLALARAYLMTGQIAAGFRTLRVLLDRKEVPDLHDVNVALTALSAYHPARAATMLERMVEQGIGKVVSVV